jgi:hypothetical protein
VLPRSVARRQLRRAGAIVLFASLTLGTLGCAQRRGEPLYGGDSSGSGPSGDHELDFDAPLGALGTEVQDVVAAGLPFIPIQPPRETATVRRFIYNPKADPSASMVAFAYDDAQWGRVVILEYSDSRTQEGLLEEKAGLKGGGCSPVPGYEVAQACSYDPFEPVDLGAGVTALVGTGDETTSLTWVGSLKPAPGFAVGDFAPNNSLTVEVMGEATTFSPSEAIEFGKLAVGI